MKEFIKKIPIIKDIAHWLKFLYQACVQTVFLVIYKIEMGLLACGLKKDEPCFQKLKEFKDKYKGERCFIICTGPSLRFEDLETLHKNNEYTFSMNSIIKSLDKTNFRPTFYCVQDKEVYSQMEEYIYNSNIENIFLGISNIKFKRTLINYKKHVEDPRVVTYRLNTAYRWLAINYPESKGEFAFSNDCEMEIYDGGIVAFSIVQIAKYMGFEEIYFLGADCDYTGSVNHFDNIHQPKYDKNLGNYHLRTYEYLKAIIKDTDIKIYNATRGGKLETFTRVNFDDLF